VYQIVLKSVSDVKEKHEHVIYFSERQFYRQFILKQLLINISVRLVYFNIKNE
jgi:hypothetical protein